MKLPMKLLRIVGLCLTAMFAVSMFASATASAAVHWEQCSEGGSATKYSEHQCTKAEGSGKWQWNEPATTEAVVIKGSLRLIDTDTILGVAEVECYGEASGTIGPGKAGTTNSVTVEKKNCHNIQNCTTLEKVEARNTPWNTELFETEAKLLEKLVSGTGGEPGWAVTCKVLTNFTDTCTQVSGKEETLALANESTSGVLLVRATFNNGTRHALCSQSGKETGEVIGKLAILKTNGWGLRIS